MTSSNSNRPLRMDDLKKPDLAEGENPFRDELAEEGKEADVNAPADYRGAYETEANSRGIVLLLSSLVAFFASAMPMTRFSWPIASGLLGLFGWVLCLIIAPVALAYAVADLKAIRMGQLSGDGAWQTHCAFWISLLTILNAAATVVAIIYESFMVV